MRIVIIEDEPAAARQLKKMLELAPGLNINSLSICSSSDEVKTRLKEGLDLLFLDLNIRGESGFDVVEEFLAEPFETIITTAYPEHALRAFEVGALDYLVKPFSQERLEQAISKTGNQETAAVSPLKKILVKQKGKITSVSVESIVMVKSAGDYAELISDDGCTHLLSKSMDYLEHRLPADFMRIHRTVIARLSRIESLAVAGGGKYSATLAGVKDPVPVGRKYYAKLKEKLGD